MSAKQRYFARLMLRAANLADAISAGTSAESEALEAFREAAFAWDEDRQRRFRGNAKHKGDLTPRWVSCPAQKPKNMLTPEYQFLKAVTEWLDALKGGPAMGYKARERLRDVVVNAVESRRPRISFCDRYGARG